MARRFRILLIAIVTGIAVAQLATLEWNFLWILGVLAGATAFTSMVATRPLKRSTALIACGLAAGVLLWQIHTLRSSSQTSPPPSAPMEFSGWVSDVRRPNARLAILEVRPDPVGGLFPNRVVVRFFGYERFSYGDRIQVKCRFRAPEEEVEASRWVCTSSTATILSRRTEGNAFFRWLDHVRAKLDERIALLLPEPESAVVKAMVMGRDETLPDGLFRAFRATGLSHLLVFSGMNVIIILKLADWVIGRMMASRVIRGALLIATAVVVLGLVGFTPSSVRAVLMAVVAIASQLLGRGKARIHTLVVVGAIMVMVAPTIISDVSFQLSFAATAGIILWEEGIRDRLNAMGCWHEISSVLAMTLSAMTLTTLLVAAFAPVVGAWSILSNAIVGILSAMVLPLSLTILAVSWALPALASSVVALPLSALVWVIVGVVEALGRLQSFPLAQSAAAVVASYVIASFLALMVWKRYPSSLMFNA